ncbi:unnamed protein product [Didymodactylos carnosus]|uniref:procollagen-proline 4-dioxygenase n=1 Tax=Didymodactylos carnosus TaxID=1234261 RepID=A0A8S2GDD7_9BILA|nr:unnamed protein product [Didymodactylos carnosus]CAF3497151.1 unnamed protein product [Didymodactylos carnosus]
MQFLFVFFLITNIYISNIRLELFTSITHLTHLLNTEVELGKRLEGYLKEEYERLHNVEKFLNVIKDEVRQAQQDSDHYFGNPVNAYLFIKHLTAEWYAVEDLIKPENGKDLIKQIGDDWIFPSFEDYTGSATALMRLQDTYELNTSQVANGEISSNFKSKKLSARECFDLGRVAYTNNDYYHTLMWMQEALDHLDSEPGNDTTDKLAILDHLAYATSQQGNIEHALALTDEMLNIVPDHLRAKNNKIYYEAIIKNRTLTKQQRKGDLGHDDNDLGAKITHIEIKRSTNDNFEVKNIRPSDYLEEREIYERLCRQNTTHLNVARQSKLFCRYRHNNHPRLIIAPLKEELLLDRPEIFLFHDIISSKDIEEIKSLASPKLKRAVVQNPKTAELEAANYRVSKSAWLRNEDSPAVARLTQLIGDATNLSMITAEDLQIANYGVGGHYEPHFDFARVRKKSEKDAFSSLGAGNRIATWLTYLSNVERGGATVFPVAGARLVPKKGSAAFWYNLFASGEGDYSTRHAACPVLIGNKWVANKWIHERGQEFRRPCSIDPMA